MNKSKIWILVAICLMIVGSIVFVASDFYDGLMPRFNKVEDYKITTQDINQISIFSSDEEDYKIITHDINETFDKLSLTINVAKVEIKASEDDKCKVECYETEDENFDVEVKNETLTINSNLTGKAKGFKIIDINIGSIKNPPKVIIYLPKNTYKKLEIDDEVGNISIEKDLIFDDVNIELDTGEILFEANVNGQLEIENDAGSIEINSQSITDVICSVDAGPIKASNINCEHITLETDIGRIEVSNVIASKNMKFQSEVGEIKIDDCDGKEIYIETDTGSISGRFLTDKNFIIKTDVGKVNVPKTTTGGRCEIKTSVGSIEIKEAKGN